MSSPIFLITNSLNGSLDDLRKRLLDKGILTKDYIDDGLMLLYHKYDTPISSELERECRSLVIDRETLKIISYSCEEPRLNKEGLDYLLEHSDAKKLINECFEGTYLSLFYYKNIWYLSTRRCLNSKDSKITDVSHYDMFLDTIGEEFDTFTSKLDKSKSYYFILIHHNNKHTIDYEYLFGTNYKKLCLTSVKDDNMQELDVNNFIIDNSNIMKAQQYDNIDNFAELNKTLNYNTKPKHEGIIIRVWSNDENKYRLIKLQYNNYQFNQVLGPENNTYRGLIYLYQNDKLVEYFEQNSTLDSIKKIKNPYNPLEIFDTIGMVDSVFKVCTSELFELFKILWSIQTGKQKNTILYNLLPKEFKDIFFGIRGIYYKKKSIQYDIENKNKSYLRIMDIYNFLKSLPTETFLAFLRMRKLMFNWAKTNINLKEYLTISSQCDKVHIKLCSIFTNKLYPKISATDIPPQKEKEKDEVVEL